MIFDRIENINSYGIELNFVTDFLKENTFISGRTDIEKSEKFCLGLEYKTKAADGGLWEAHRKYLDIHVVFSGEELVHIADISQSTSTKEYEEDYELFNSAVEHVIHLKPGYFLILFPHEVHKTGVELKEQSDIKKFVFKKKL